VVVSAVLAPAFEEALAAGAEATSSFELAGTGNWSIEALFDAEPDRAGLESRLWATAAAGGAAAPLLEITPLPDRDWVAESLKALPSIKAGRFVVHGGHDRDRAPDGGITLEVSAGRAFGTGHHETTRGCLLALDHLAKARRFRRPLDLGCGSGVLALAMARLWRRPVVASDIDPWAVRVTAANARLNHLHPWLCCRRADGFADPGLAAGVPYDLITANILAGPLRRLARPLRRHLAPGGVAVLSGLLLRQERSVLNAYRDQDLRLARRIVLGDWPTLILTRPR
jgi:ribosomal protein L11 methyltransferase